MGAKRARGRRIKLEDGRISDIGERVWDEMRELREEEQRGEMEYHGRGFKRDGKLECQKLKGLQRLVRVFPVCVKVK